MNGKRIFKTIAVLDPTPGRALVSSGQIKHLSVFDDHIRLGRSRILYGQMLSRRIQDGCIQFWDGTTTIRFAIQGFGSKGAPDPFLTQRVNDLMDSIVTHDGTTVAAIVREMGRVKRSVGASGTHLYF